MLFDQYHQYCNSLSEFDSHKGKIEEGVFSGVDKDFYFFGVEGQSFCLICINFIMSLSASQILKTHKERSKGKNSLKSNFTTINLHKGMNSSNFYGTYSPPLS